MSRFNVRPENAIKRCEELCRVGMQQAALDTLHTVLSNKRNRASWQKVHEQIILRYLDLCVELRKGRIAKDGLHQYKSICQQVAIGSLEVAIRHLVDLSEAKAKEAQDAVDEAMDGLGDMADLEEEATPESMMLLSVTADDTKERKGRELLTPWLKFLWETYRTVLEILRNNAKLERLYQSIAQSAFNFCLRYQRKTEVRRLGDMLRNHLQQVQKYSTNQNAINLSAPESLQMHLETRFVQLDIAGQLELWQEAYRGIEDIHNLMTISKKSPKPQMLAAYYSKLAETFWRSDNHLIHAAALHKLFFLSLNQNKGMKESERRQMASRVILATITIPVARVKGKTEAYLETDTHNKKSRLATLLGSSVSPTRASLIAEMKAANIFQLADPVLVKLYDILEVEFQPLQLCERLEPMLAEIKADEVMNNYTPVLQEIILTRLLKQLGQVYQTVTVAHITSMATFYTAREVEYFIAKAVHKGNMYARLDHKSKSITFNAEMYCMQKQEVVEGPHIQSSQGEKVRDQLSLLAQSMQTAVNMIIHKTNGAMSTDPNFEANKRAAVGEILKNSALEHKKALDRRQFIERNKEKIEELAKQKERETYKLRMEQRRSAHAAEKERLLQESKKRDEERLKKQRDEAQHIILVERMKELKQAMGANSSVFDGVAIDEFAKMDADEIVAKQVEHLDKEQQITKQKHRSILRKLDHMERAKRAEEIPLYLAQYEVQKQEDRKLYDAKDKARSEAHKEQHKHDLEVRSRILTIMDHVNAYQSDLMASRRQEFEERERQFYEHVQQVKQERLEMRRIQIEREEEERHQQEMRRQREEEERIRREEDERQRREEQERLREEAEREQTERREQQQQMAEKQRERELEAERRQQERGPGPQAGGWRSRQSEGPRDDGPPRQQGGWRSREPEGGRGGYGGDRDQGRGGGFGGQRGGYGDRDGGRGGYGGDRGGDRGGYGGDRGGYGDRDGGRGGYGGDRGGYGGDRGGYGGDRRGDDGPSQASEGSWSRGQAAPQQRRGPPRGDAPPRQEGGWRSQNSTPPQERHEERQAPAPSSDGFEAVSRGRRR